MFGMIALQRANEKSALQGQVAELTRQVQRLEYGSRVLLDPNNVARVLHDLATSIDGVAEVNGLSDQAFLTLNSVLVDLGLDTVDKIFSLAVTAQVETIVHIEVKASSIEEAISMVKTGDFDNDIIKDMKYHNSTVADRSNVIAV